MAGRGRTKGVFHFSEKYLINKLKEAFALLGHPVSGRDMTSLKGFPSRSVYEQRFGKWGNALKAAGLPRKKDGPAKGSISPNRRPRKNPRTRTACLSVRFKIMERDGFTCQYCGRTPQDGCKLVVDHVVPYSKGGLTIDSNLLTSCFDCNIGKGDSMLELHELQNKNRTVGKPLLVKR